jgi:hypothetical protein
MKVYRGTSDSGWVFIAAAGSHQEAYEMMRNSDMGYVDIDSVHTIEGVFTPSDEPMILDEF